jgi:predicted transcriptional regulator
MKGISRLLYVALVFSTSSVSYAEVSDNSLNKLLDLSGITKQVDQFPGVIKAGLAQSRQQGAAMPDAEYGLLVTSVDESIVPTQIIAQIRASLHESINQEEANQLLSWYESDLGKEITRAEEKASTPEAYQEMMQSAQSLMQDLERLEYAMRFDMSLGLTRMAMDLQKHSGIAVYSAIMTTLQPDVPLDLEPLKAQMKAERAQVREALQQMIHISLIYSYKDLGIDKLKDYEIFLHKPATKKFTKSVIDSMRQALKTSVSKWADALAVILKGKKQN